MKILDGLIHLLVKLMITDRSEQKKFRRSDSATVSIEIPVKPPVFSTDNIPFGVDPMTKADVLRSFKKILRTYFPSESQGSINLSLNELSDEIDRHYQFLREKISDFERDLDIVKDSVRMMREERRQADKSERDAIDEDILSETKEYLDEYAKTVLPAKEELARFKSDKRDFFVDFLNRAFNETDAR